MGMYGEGISKRGELIAVTSKITGTGRNVSNFRYSAIQIPSNYIHYTPWPKSSSELYRPSDGRLSAKLEPTFADISVNVLSSISKQ
jgi:hypothetical protein